MRDFSDLPTRHSMGRVVEVMQFIRRVDPAVLEPRDLGSEALAAGSTRGSLNGDLRWERPP